MTQFIKCKVVILPTDKATKFGIQYQTNKLAFNPKLPFEGHHLYILNDEEVKEGDYIIDFGAYKTPLLFCVRHSSDLTYLNHETKKGITIFKIIATTDTSLNLPLIPDDFIQAFCENNGEMHEVIIENELISDNKEYKYPEILEINYNVLTKLKITSNNTIIIKPHKETWTREEVIQLLRSAWRASYTYYMPKFTYDFDNTNKWIDNNIDNYNGK